MTMKNLIPLLALTFAIGCAQPTEGWIALFNGRDLKNWKETDYAGRGNVVVKNGELHMENGLVITGVHYTNKTVLPKPFPSNVFTIHGRKISFSIKLFGITSTNYFNGDRSGQ